MLCIDAHSVDEPERVSECTGVGVHVIDASTRAARCSIRSLCPATAEIDVEDDVVLPKVSVEVTRG